MNREFSSSWISSGKAGKQRKYRANAPLHIKRRFLSAHLSKELKSKLKTRSMELRKGDTAKVMRGQFRGKTGKVERIMVKEEKAQIAGIERKKEDGSKSFYMIHASNLMITELNMDDKRRTK